MPPKVGDIIHNLKVNRFFGITFLYESSYRWESLTHKGPEKSEGLSTFRDLEIHIADGTVELLRKVSP